MENLITALDDIIAKFDEINEELDELIRDGDVSFFQVNCHDNDCFWKTVLINLFSSLWL